MRPFFALALLAGCVPVGLFADSPTSLKIERSVVGKASLRFPSAAGTRYTVETSEDLKTWTTVRSGLSGTDAELLVSDLEGGTSTRFFRVVSRSGAEETIKVTKTYSSGEAAGTLELGEDPRPFDEKAAAERAEPSVDDGDGLFGGDGLEEGGAVISIDVDRVGDIDGGGLFGGGGLSVDADFDSPVSFLGDLGGGGGAEVAVPGGGFFGGGDADGLTIEPWPWPPIERPEIQPGARVLTAGEWNDHEHWSDFQGFLREYPRSFTEWQLDLQRRVILTFIDPDERPLHDVRVTYNNTCFDGATARTQNDGRVAFFLTKEMAECVSQESLNLTIQVAGALYETGIELTGDDDQEWTLEVPLKKVSEVRKLDLAWVVDVTGSMGDELNFIKEELIDIVDQIRDAEQFDEVRIATVFYRDRRDQFVTRVHDFTDDLSQVQDDIDGQRASGGGDFPESVNEAMLKAMRELSWGEEDTVRLAFLVADAPPHYYSDEQYTYRDVIPDAHELAIKLFPVAGSGIDKTTEYLFRNLAVASMGKYVFITDDSGVGGGHIDPDIEQVEVETLNQILIRTILEEYRRGRQ